MADDAFVAFLWVGYMNLKYLTPLKDFGAF